MELSFSNPRIIAGGIAMFVAWKFHNTILTLVVGMCALWLLSL